MVRYMCYFIEFHSQHRPSLIQQLQHVVQIHKTKVILIQNKEVETKQSAYIERRLSYGFERGSSSLKSYLEQYI
jgi:hypothetical protein